MLPPEEVAVANDQVFLEYSLAFGPDGRKFVSSGSNRKTLVWDATVNPPKVSHELEGHEDVVLSVASSSDGKMVASGDWKGTIRIWDVTGNLPVEIAALSELAFPVCTV